MNLKSIENIFNKKTNKTKLIKRINPEDDWKIVLKIYFTIIIVLTIFSLYFLYKIKNEDLFQINQNTNNNPTSIDQKILDSILTSFEEKNKRVEDIKLGNKFFIDPSK